MSRHIVHILFLRGRGANQTPNGWGVDRGRGALRHDGPQCTPSEGSGEQRPGSIPGSCSPLPENPVHPYSRPLAMTVASRPPTGRVLVVTVMCPSPFLRLIGLLPEPMGGDGGRIVRSEFASGGAPGYAVSVGDTTQPGVASDPATQVEQPVVLTLRGTGGTRCQASAWFAWTPHFQREGGPHWKSLNSLTRDFGDFRGMACSLPRGSRDSKS